jgi:hypothetical protein
MTPTPFATSLVNLKPYNTLALAANTATQLQIVGGGHYYIQILNLGTGNIFIKGDSTVGTGDSASYKLPINMSLTPLVAGSIWIMADAAGTASVALLPKP